MIKEINAADFDKLVLSGGKVILDFYSTDCPPCEALAVKFEGIAELFYDKVTFLKIFRQENRHLAEKLNVNSSPTILFFDHGKEVGSRLSGGIKRSQLIDGLKVLLGNATVEHILANVKPVITECDVAILGGGPGGLTTGLYLCQARINTVLIDTGLPGGQVSTTHQVSNYPGFIDPQPGYLLSHNMSEQTKRCGTTYKVAVDVTDVDLEQKIIELDKYETIKSKSIVIATGTTPNLLNIVGEKEYKGNGISYCATCDAKYYVNKEVVVIGGGNSAVEEADFIAKFASKITIIHQFDHLQANKMAQEKIFSNPKITTLFECEPRSFSRKNDKMITSIENLRTKEKTDIISDGIFVFIGMRPNLDLFSGQLELDKWGYIITDEDMKTNIPNVFAVGDVISKKYRQITTAIADGTIAAIAITKEMNN